MRVSIIIPSYNESGSLRSFLKKLLAVIANSNETSQQFIFSVVVVDDGSKVPIKKSLIHEIMMSNDTKIFLLRHTVNLGQGAALQTGIEFAREQLGADLYVTMDSDGQHSERDLLPMLKHLIGNNADIVFGNRFHNDMAMTIPKSRFILLKLATIFERKLTGLPLGDAHNGFRIFNRKCAELIDLKLNRMAHATEFKQIVSRNSLKFTEFPVSIQYSPETLAKGQANSGAVIILRDLLKTFLFERF